MPFYDYSCDFCGHTWEEKYTIANRNIPTENPCPNCDNKEIKLVIGSVNIADPVSLGVKKPDKAFVNRLKQIEDTYSKPAGNSLRSRYTKNITEI